MGETVEEGKLQVGGKRCNAVEWGELLRMKKFQVGEKHCITVNGDNYRG
jgi:hypothetical protein